MKARVEVRHYGCNLRHGAPCSHQTVRRRLVDSGNNGTNMSTDIPVSYTTVVHKAEITSDLFSVVVTAKKNGAKSLHSAALLAKLFLAAFGISRRLFTCYFGRVQATQQSIMNREIGRLRFGFIAPIDLGKSCRINLYELSCNSERFTIDQFIASLEATTTVTKLSVEFCDYESTPGNYRRVIEPICRCISDLRQHNPNHTLLRKLDIREAQDEAAYGPFLVAAKQYGIHHLILSRACLRIQHLAEFCRGNTHLKVMEIYNTSFSDDELTISVPPQDEPQDSSFILALEELIFSDEDSTISVPPQDVPQDSLAIFALDELSFSDEESTISVPQDSLAILALNELTMSWITFENANVVTEFSNFIARVTYPALNIGEISMIDDNDAENEEGKKIACLRIVPQLIMPSVEQLTLLCGCPIDFIGAIDACATVKHIYLDDYAPIDFRPAEVQRKVELIATRNRVLASFIANPHDYPGDVLLALVRLLDKSPTGLFMLSRSFPGIPSFFQD